MSRRRTVAAVVAATLLLTGCATSGLQNAGKLGDSGNRLTTQAAASFDLSSDQLQKDAALRCVSRVLATDNADCANERSVDVQKLDQLISARAAFYRSLSNYYTGFSGAARLKSVSLAEATNASVGLARSLATLMGNEFPSASESAFRSAGVRIEALVQMVEERRRLRTLRESSRHMRAALAVAVASYDVERDVLASIDRVALAHHQSAIQALVTKDLMDAGPLTGRAAGLVGVPVAPLTPANKAAWAAPSGRAFLTFLSVEEERQALRKRESANQLTQSGLQALAASHEEFESTDDVTTEDVDVFVQRLAVLLSRETKE